MNIALFADCFYPQVNGIVTAVHNLAEGLAQRGHKVLIIAPKYRKVEYPSFHKNVEILTVRGGPAIFYAGLKITVPFSQKILKAVKDRNIDVLHFHAPMGLGFQAILLSKILQKPLIGTFHTFFFESEYLKHAKMDNRIIKIAAMQFVRSYYNACDLVTCPTPSTKKTLEENDCTRPTVVISNGINASLFPPARLHSAGNIIDTSHPSALFVGRIAYEKNLQALVDIFEKVCAEMKDAHLYMIGGGPQTNLIKRSIEKKNLQDNIHLVGEIPHAQLVKSGAYQNADIFVTASKTENQPLTLLEAQCNGLPCVGMNAKGVPDMITDGKNGFIVAKDDLSGFAKRVIELLKDKTLRQKMRQQALAYADQHRLDVVIDQWEETYKKVIDEYKPKKRFERLRHAPAYAKERLDNARNRAKALLGARSAKRKARKHE